MSKCESKVDFDSIFSFQDNRLCLTIDFEIRFAKGTLSINEIKFENSISIYPTITNGNVFIRSLNNNTISEINVFNSIGQIIMQNIKPDISGITEINLNKNSSIYYIQVITNRGVIVRKIVINKN